MNRLRRSKTGPLLIFFIQRGSSTNSKGPHTSNLVEFSGWCAFRSLTALGFSFGFS